MRKCAKEKSPLVDVVSSDVMFVAYEKYGNDVVDLLCHHALVKQISEYMKFEVLPQPKHNK